MHASSSRAPEQVLRTNSCTWPDKQAQNLGNGKGGYLVLLLFGSHPIVLFRELQQSHGLSAASGLDWYFVVALRYPSDPACGEDFSSPYLWGRFADWLGRPWWAAGEGTLSFCLIYFCLPSTSLNPPKHIQWLALCHEKLFFTAY